MELSIVLCTYNDEKYIYEAIKSILDQSYSKFELIIVNDGSTDNTGQIIKRFEDERIKIIEKNNTGLIDSLNLGISLCKNNWVARMDGDDISIKDRLEKQIKLISEDVSVIGGQCIIIDEKNSIIGKTWFKTDHASIIKRIKYGLPVLAHPTTLINKRIFVEVGGYDKYFNVSEDLDLWIKMSQKGKIINVNDTILYLRKHSNNISYTKNNLQFLNTNICKLKGKRRIFRNLSEDEYLNLKESVESNFYYSLALKLSKYQFTKKKYLRKINNACMLILTYLATKTTY